MPEYVFQPCFDLLPFHVRSQSTIHFTGSPLLRLPGQESGAAKSSWLWEYCWVWAVLQTTFSDKNPDSVPVRVCAVGTRQLVSLPLNNRWKLSPRGCPAGRIPFCRREQA